MGVAHGIHQGGMLLPISVTETTVQETIMIYTPSIENVELLWQLLCHYWGSFY